MVDSRLLVAIAAIVVLQCCSAKDLTPQKLNKSYAKLNKYLEKNVRSEDPEVNLKAAAELADAKSSKFSLFDGKSLAGTVDLLKQFAAMSSEWYLCSTHQRNDMMSLVDAGLADESRLKTPNYALTRVDKIIQHYAIKDAIRCGYSYGFPKLAHGYRQNAYDEIDKLLVSALPSNKDVDANMAKAEELLAGMPADGAVADALRQFVQLKSLVNEDTCNERGYEILLRNDLATRNEAKVGSERPAARVAKFVQHYAKQHEQLCRPIVPALIKSALAQLDLDSYRRVLGLASARLLDQSSYGKLIEELNQKEVDGEFATPLLVAHLAKELESGNGQFELDHESWVAPETLFYYLLEASANDALKREIHGTSMQHPQGLNPYYTGNRDFDGVKLNELLAKYLFEPCTHFQQVVGGLVEADNYGVNMNIRHAVSGIGEFMKEISYHTARTGYFACKYLLDKRESVPVYIMDVSRQHEVPK